MVEAKGIIDSTTGNLGFSLSRRAAPKRKRRRKLPIPSFADVGIETSTKRCKSLLEDESSSDDESFLERPAGSNKKTGRESSCKPGTTKTKGPTNSVCSGDYLKSGEKIGCSVPQYSGAKKENLRQAHVEETHKSMAKAGSSDGGCPVVQICSSFDQNECESNPTKAPDEVAILAAVDEEFASSSDTTTVKEILMSLEKRFGVSLKSERRTIKGHLVKLVEAKQAEMLQSMELTTAKPMAKPPKLMLKEILEPCHQNSSSTPPPIELSKHDTSKALRSVSIAHPPTKSVNPASSPQICPSTSVQSNETSMPTEFQILSALDIIFAEFEGKPFGIKTSLKHLEAQFKLPLPQFESAIKKHLIKLKKSRKASNDSELGGSGALQYKNEITASASVPTGIGSSRLSPPTVQANCVDLMNSTLAEPIIIQQQPMPFSFDVNSNLKVKAQTARMKTRRSCSLCRNCVCTMTNNTKDNESVDLSKSDFAVERALMRQLVKLEQQTDICIDREVMCRRRLKKHRKDMYKKRQVLIERGLCTDQPKSRFLPDVDQVEELEQRTGLTKSSESAVSLATSSTFGRRSCSIKKVQPTLTQMIGGKVAGPPGSPVLVSDKETLAPIVEEEEVDESGNEVEPDKVRAAPVCNKEALDVSPEVPFRRINPGDENGVGVVSAWGSTLSGSFRTTWDWIFEDPSKAQNLDLEDLVNILEGESNDEDDHREEGSVRLSMLSQRGQAMANSVIDQIREDRVRVAKLNIACPKWEENVLFAMFQREGASVEDALEEVQKSKIKLMKARDSILKVVAQQEAVLNIFSESLTVSRDRFSNPDLSLAPDGTASEGFMLSQIPQANETGGERRRSFDDEVTTLQPSASPAMEGDSLLLPSPT